MPTLHTHTECCGCTACEAVCPKNAISMIPDDLGFRYPVVDMEKCIECKACERVCAFIPDYKTPDNYKEPIPYGVRLKNIDEVMKSRSGGAFVAFSDWVLDRGGVIYGAGFSGFFKVTHKRALTPEERDEFRGSKYVQSDLTGIFRRILEDLKENRLVLFSGTPCQVAGLSSFIPKKYHENLILVDIICHGVPSPRVWEEYLKYVKQKTGKEIIAVNFRNKNPYGWKSSTETITLKDPVTSDVVVSPSNIFTYLFFKHIMLRPACANCKYCNVRRPSDLTLGDFWGWEKTDTEINKDDKGLSLVLVNTPKGNDIFSTVIDRFIFITPKLEDCMQNRLRGATDINPDSQKFASDFTRKGFKYVLYRYGNVGLRYKISRIPSKAKSIFKNILKRVLK